MSRNRLSETTSPYLLQQADNPVHWYPWGDEAFAAAKAEDKPILLSIGYAACHWCHVMAHESFENDGIADLMNRYFINIKVDREERPDLDQVYQMALALTGQPGGWPLTMFLTPDRRPFWGGTYFPPYGNFGRPGFPDVLMHLSRAYREDREKVVENAHGINQSLSRIGAHADPGILPDENTLKTFDHILLANVDFAKGGTLGAPKFPQASLFDYLWRRYLITDLEKAGRAVLVTATALCQGGIYDHLGGGFARYSTDGDWLVPHFEKMLYDNAQLIKLLTRLYCATGLPLFKRRIEETVNWMKRDLWQEGDGGFAGTLDADSEGVEGKYYVWSESDIDTALGDQAPDFKKAYGVIAEGNWEEDQNILNRPLDNDDPLADFQSARSTLLSLREKRIPPGLDHKILLDWNAMAVSALCDAGMVFNRPDWVTLAVSLFDNLVDRFDDNGILSHSWCDGSLNANPHLDDYAHMADCALTLFEATAEDRFFDRCLVWLKTADDHFWDQANGGYFLSPTTASDVVARLKVYTDSATPAGNGIMAQVHARLYHLTGDQAHFKRAEDTIAASIPSDHNHMVHGPSLLTAYGYLHNTVTVTIDGNDPVTAKRLRQSAFKAPLPYLAITCGDPSHSKTAAHICKDKSCGPPISDASDLLKALSQP